MAQEKFGKRRKLPVLINKNITVSLKIESREDLPKLKAFMEANNLKINKSEVAR